MIIDFHTHTFPEKIAERAVSALSGAAHLKPFSDATEASLIAGMRAAGIDGSVILPVATSPAQVEHINDASAAINARQSEEDAAERRPFLISLGAMHPDYAGAKEELARLKDLGILGIKVHPVYLGVDLDDPRYLRIFDRCAELGLFVVTHAGLDIGFPGVVHSSPAMGRHVLEEVPGLVLVMAHMGGWQNWREAGEELAGTDCFIDTAFSQGRYRPLDDGYWKEEDTQMLSDEEMLRLIRLFGADRVLFGSDSPWSDQGESARQLMRLPLTEAEREKIFSGNAGKLLDLYFDTSVS